MMPEYSDRTESGIESTARNKTVLMVGAFPPPVHGMAAVNEVVRDQLAKSGAELLVINVAAKNLERSLAVRLGRIQRIVRGFTRLLFVGGLKDATLYMSVSGGFGQIYDILFLVFARLRNMRIYLHHHSFAYLDRTSLLARTLTVVAGSDSVHITLSDGMAAGLQAQYPSVCRVLSVSNAVFFSSDQPSSIAIRTSLKTIGFISNISEEKGIFDFLDLVAMCEAEGLPINAKIAGPCQDEGIENKLRERISKLNTVEYLGPQYGSDKEQFFNEIDALIFPTNYINEAEPLTIHEAMQRAIPVISYGRGCIPEIVCPDCGMAIDPALLFAPTALVLIKQWLGSSDHYRVASSLAAEHFASALAENISQWQELRKAILGGDATNNPVVAMEDSSSST